MNGFDLPPVTFLWPQLLWLLLALPLLAPRGLGVALAAGMTPREIMLGTLARAADPSSGGRQVPGHYSHRGLRIVTASRRSIRRFLYVGSVDVLMTGPSGYPGRREYGNARL